MQEITLSVVIITRNEEANIARCIESVLQALRSLRTEILLVDSASTDKTVEIASRYPVTILQLDAQSDLSPSAGRFVGARHAQGPFILFLDGDMVLIEGWVATAIQEMANPMIAGVSGRVFLVFPGEELTRDHPASGTLGRVASLGGAALYRADALAVSGSFNPFVKGEEERELGYRITARGYQLVRNEVPMVYHIAKHRSVTEVDEKASYFQGVGQILRAYPGSEITADILRIHARAIRLALTFVAGMSFVALVLLLSGNEVRAGTMFVGAATLLWLKIKGSLRKAPLVARFRILLLFNMLQGWLQGIPDQSCYKISLRVVRLQANSSAHVTLEEG
jgi:glycosyltransferase involved in cell wall biosynthesis